MNTPSPYALQRAALRELTPSRTQQHNAQELARARQLLGDHWCLAVPVQRKTNQPHPIGSKK